MIIKLLNGIEKLTRKIRFYYISIKHRKDEIFLKKVGKIREKLIDYYLTFYEQEEAKLMADEILIEAISMTVINLNVLNQIMQLKSMKNQTIISTNLKLK